MQMKSLSGVAIRSHLMFFDTSNSIMIIKLLFNIAMFSLTPAQAESLTMLGFEPVTQLYSQTPFLVVKTSSGHLLPEYLVNNFSLKMLDANHWRISCYIPGTLDSPPKECASLLINVLRSKL